MLFLIAAAPGTSEWERYLQHADRLKQYRDKGGLKERDVLKVLRQAGVFQKMPLETGEKFRSYYVGFRPFKVRHYGTVTNFNTLLPNTGWMADGDPAIGPPVQT